MMTYTLMIPLVALTFSPIPRGVAVFAFISSLTVAVDWGSRYDGVIAAP
jgi:hypothetical protein